MYIISVVSMKIIRESENKLFLICYILYFLVILLLCNVVKKSCNI